MATISSGACSRCGGRLPPSPYLDASTGQPLCFACHGLAQHTEAEVRAEAARHLDRADELERVRLETEADERVLTPRRCGRCGGRDVRVLEMVAVRAAFLEWLATDEVLWTPAIFAGRRYTHGCSGCGARFFSESTGVTVRRTLLAIGLVVGGSVGVFVARASVWAALVCGVIALVGLSLAMESGRRLHALIVNPPL